MGWEGIGKLMVYCETTRMNTLKKNQDFCAAEIITEAAVAGGLAVQRFLPLN